MTKKMLTGMKSINSNKQNKTKSEADNVELRFGLIVYSKTCLKRPLKNRQTKMLMANGTFMKVKSIAECSPWSILQYF